jgi:hypothetical protein
MHLSEEGAAFVDNARKHASKLLAKKTWRSSLPYQGHSKRTIENVVRGWDKEETGWVAEQRPQKVARHSRACNTVQDYFHKEKASKDQEAPDRAEHRTDTLRAVAFLGEECFEDFLLCEEASRLCVKAGYCEDNGRYWNIAWKAEIIHKRKGLVADRAFDNQTTVNLSFLRLSIRNGNIEFVTRRWSQSTKKEQRQYEDRQQQIHLAAIELAKTASSYIRNWPHNTPAVLSTVRALCPCPDCVEPEDEEA